MRVDEYIRFLLHLALRPENETSFHEGKLREIVLSRTATDAFELSFLFSTLTQADAISAETEQDPGEIPEYVMIDEDAP